jgi:serine/threonine protein kinase
MFPNATEDCVRLLKSMLQFDPCLRISTDNALNDPFFNPIKEQGYVSPPTGAENVSPNSEATDSSQASMLPHHVGEALNPDKEKIRESPLHLKHNVSCRHLTFLISLTLSSVFLTVYSRNLEICASKRSCD